MPLLLDISFAEISNDVIFFFNCYIITIHVLLILV